jgi:predicted ATPase
MKEAGSDSEFNLADMGFGISQMLPFLVQMWYVLEYEVIIRARRRAGLLSMSRLALPSSFIVAIEQPELHLHPALQSRLADLFVSTAKLSSDRKMPVRFVLETHSPVIIERIGSHVEAGSLRPTDVQVLLFERGESAATRNTATIRASEFDEGGVLKDWPLGFLAPLPPPLVRSDLESAST